MILPFVLCFMFMGAVMVVCVVLRSAYTTETPDLPEIEHLQ